MYTNFFFLAVQKDEDDFDWQDDLNQKLKSKNEDDDKKAKVAKITNKGQRLSSIESGQTNFER